MKKPNARKPKQPIKIETFDDLPPFAVSLATTACNLTGLWRYLRPEYQDKTPPCQDACPANQKIEEWIRLVEDEKYGQAGQLIKQDNPFPRICGRVCFYPCEANCNRSHFDRSVAIKDLERFVGDASAGQGKSFYDPESIKKTGKSIGIVGAGPCGLACGYFLALSGHSVTIFEAAPKPGGLLRYGIPEYRLPKNILQEEINEILELGIDLRCGLAFGRDISFGDLCAYDAAVLAFGATKPRELDIPGANLAQVTDGISFLERANKGEASVEAKQIVVIGGGNTAIDVARTAIRKNVKVTIACIESRSKMPAFGLEIEEAIREGATLVTEVLPQHILRTGDLGLVLEMVKFKDENVIPNSSFLLEADYVVNAIGRDPDYSYLPEKVAPDGKKIILDNLGRIPGTNIFASGTLVSDKDSVIESIAAGKLAASNINKTLSGSEVKAKEKGKEKKVVEFEDINTDYFDKIERTRFRQLSLSEREGNFLEVVSTFSKEQASSEVTRCFHCGHCTFCDNCFIFCPDFAISKVLDAQRSQTNYEIDYDYCKGCGICVFECPRSAISYVEEEVK